MCQFNYFVNANAEALRASFVAHEAKQPLVISEEGSAETLDFGTMTRQMTDLIEKNVVDPTLRAWALPNFSTTTATDTTVAAVLLMATLKEYFCYTFCGIACGIPRVTLEGERADWMKILERLEKLKEYGIETIAWYHLLRPVLVRFVAAFDAPESSDNVDFWSRVAHYHSNFSGPSYYSGWINAFNVFSEKGKWLGKALDATVVSEFPAEDLSAETFWSTFSKRHRSNEEGLILDGTPYHSVESGKLAVGFTAVDVLLDDNGVKTECAMLAGLVGTRVSDSKDKNLSKDGKDDTVTPVAGWWMYVKKA